MYTSQKILCVITARGGSKRLPGKHLLPLCGKPLIAYAIEAAKESKYIDRLIVSTDDEAIAAAAKECGAEVPFMRPTELAGDMVPSVPVLQHALNQIEEAGEKIDLVVLVQPTVPGVQAADIDAAIEKLVELQTNSCITISEITDPPEWMYRLEDTGVIVPYLESDESVRSQDLQKLYRVNGAVYVMRRETLLSGKLVDKKSNAGVIMPRERSVDIDTAVDFKIARAMMEK